MGYSETSKAYRIYVFGQREVEISHDVTFDEDVALGKVRDPSISKEDKDEDARKQKEPKDEPMPDVEGSMDPIDPPPGDPSTSRKRPLWLKYTLEYVERHIYPFVKVRRRTGIKDT